MSVRLSRQKPGGGWEEERGENRGGIERGRRLLGKETSRDI